MTSGPDSTPAVHYFDADPDVPSKPKQIELVLPDVYATLTTDTGVFSHNRIDPGTKYLLAEHPRLEDTTRNVLDIGCGYGPIALATAMRYPDAAVWGVDVNERALDLARMNAATLELDNVSFATPTSLEFDGNFDVILSNPPIRIGKSQLHELLERWLAKLTPHGTAWLVVQKHLGSDSLARWLSSQGFPAQKLGSRQGYRILEVTRELPEQRL